MRETGERETGRDRERRGEASERSTLRTQARRGEGGAAALPDPSVPRFLPHFQLGAGARAPECAHAC
eukprot:6187865-Pleurochrysis_carterae.AAC.2